jgi:hypothetical protein
MSSLHILPMDDEHSLTTLARELTQLQTCLTDVKAGYLKWQEDRLERLLTWLITQPIQPEFVVFPECSVPFECLRPRTCANASYIILRASPWGFGPSFGAPVLKNNAQSIPVSRCSSQASRT